MKTLVTGASGHLGANLVRRLLQDGEAVRVLLRADSDDSAVEGLEVERVYGDLRDFLATKAAVHGCERVYHCAAKVSTLEGGDRLRREIYDCNVLGTRHVLRAALETGVARVVVTGSLSAVGYDSSRPSDESMPFDPFDRPLPYAASKALVEHECLKAAADGLEVVVAISCAIVGPQDFGPSRMGRTLCDYAKGRLRAYVPGGFEFVAARDIVQGHLLAMSRGRPGQRYIFSTQYMTTDDLMSLFESVTGRPRPRLRLSPPLMSAAAHVSSFFLTRLFPEAEQRFTPGAVRLLRMRRRADCSKARQELGYRPTDLAQAVKEAYGFFAQRGLI